MLAPYIPSMRIPDSTGLHLGLTQLPSGLTRLLALGLTLCVLVACEDAIAPEVRQITIIPEAGLVLGTGTERFVLSATDADGASFEPTGVQWSVDDPAIATVVNEGVVRGVQAGVTMVTATVAGVSVSASVEVFVPASVSSYEPGVSYFGRNRYVEYIPGVLPVVLSAPHGGDLTPSEIQNRMYGVTATDRNTLELTLAVRDALVDLTGSAPHVVLSHLDRSKLDPNREIEEAAQGNVFAEHAWEEFHEHIERARAVVRVRGEGMYFDMHGHGHPLARLELGYLLSADDLNQSDFFLNSLAVVLQSSIRELGRDSPIPFAELLRGPTSFGGLLEVEGVAAVPSPTTPGPGSEPYFSGGYNTLRHGSLGDSELISGIQIEHQFPGLRDTDENRRDYAARLAVVIRDFMLEHIGYFEP